MIRRNLGLAGIQSRTAPSALIMMGVYAGVIAGLAVFPVMVPLLYRLVQAESNGDSADLYAQTAGIGLQLERGLPPDLEGVVAARGVRFTGDVVLEVGDVSQILAEEDHICASSARVRGQRDDGLATFCFETSKMRVVAAYQSKQRSYLDIGFFAATLGVIAGLATALGVLRILRPLQQVGRTLDRVGSGERGVRMLRTGIAEIDKLVDRVNSAALAVEEREHAILNRVRLVQEMARLVAHEVRNPLQSLELLTTLLGDESDPVERKALANGIHAEIRTLDDVVTRLLTEGASRGSLRLHLEEESILAVAQHVVSMKAPDAKRRGASLEVRASGTERAWIDRPLVSRSLENLIVNALRATPSVDGLVQLVIDQKDGFTRIAVEDNGPGIDPELGDTIFEPNVSGAGGNGIGLSLARGVAEAHGGHIRVQRSPLGGARFILEFPDRPPDGHGEPL